MATKFYTADWHLASPNYRVYDRPYNSVIEMNDSLIANCNAVASKDDIVMHLGDFACFGNDGGFPGLKINPSTFIEKINATFVNVEGNHDLNNKVKSIGFFAQTNLGKAFYDVSIGHYPSYHEKMKKYMQPGWIHLCGHVHRLWKFFLDKDRRVLNINVGVDVWNYKPVSEDELIQFIQRLVKTKFNRQ